MSVAQVNEFTAAEIDMWMIRAATEPFTARRIDYGLAQIAMWLHNVNCKKGKQKPLQDFLLFKPANKSEPVDKQIMNVFGKLMAPPVGKN
jgi:hypothetical protein